jgi:hypothetical protein
MEGYPFKAHFKRSARVERMALKGCLVD